MYFSNAWLYIHVISTSVRNKEFLGPPLGSVEHNQIIIMHVNDDYITLQMAVVKMRGKITRH